MDGNIAERYKYDAFGRRSLIETANDTGSFDILAIVNDGSDRTIDITQGEVTFNKNAPVNLTYNLEVADFHTYFVGEDGVLVHNGNRYVPVAIKRALIDSYRTPSYIKGWYQQQLNAGCSLSRIRNPPGHDWGHHPSAPASRGHGHGPKSRLELSRDNRGRGGRHGR